MKSWSRVGLGAPLLLLLCGCAQLGPTHPRAYDPVDPADPPKDREATYQAHAIRRLNIGTYEVNGQRYDSLPPYLDHSGDGADARLARHAWAWDVSGRVAWMLGGLVSSVVLDPYRHPGDLAATAALAGLGVGLTEAWAQPGRDEAAAGFNAYLDQDLGTRHAAEPLRPPTRTQGWSFSLAYHSAGLTNQDERDYVNRPDWEYRLNPCAGADLGADWYGANGFGLGLRLGVLGKAYGISHGNGDQQTFNLNAYSALGAVTYTRRLGALTGFSATGSLDLGWAHLDGTNTLVDAGGGPVGGEHLGGDAACYGPRLTLRLPGAAPWLAWDAELGYRWCRFNDVHSDAVNGSLLGPQPGRTWSGAPQVWDFSGPQVGFAVEFGRLPFSQ